MWQHALLQYIFQKQGCNVIVPLQYSMRKIRVVLVGVEKSKGIALGEGEDWGRLLLISLVGCYPELCFFFVAKWFRTLRR